jgi:hypothetical protein
MKQERLRLPVSDAYRSGFKVLTLSLFFIYLKELRPAKPAG